MNGIKYEELELRALAHMAYQCGPRTKCVFVDRDAMRELSRRHAAYHGHDWDPAPPLRMGPQRCLSSRETIERLAAALPGLLPAEPYHEGGPVCLNPAYPPHSRDSGPRG